MHSYGPPHMAVQKQDDQLELKYSNYVRTQDVTLKTCRRRWMIGRSGERGSAISVLAARWWWYRSEISICNCVVIDDLFCIFILFIYQRVSKKFTQCFYKVESKVMQYFGRIWDTIRPLRTFCGLWNSGFAWYSLYATHWIYRGHENDESHWTVRCLTLFDYDFLEFFL